MAYYNPYAPIQQTAKPRGVMTPGTSPASGFSGSRTMIGGSQAMAPTIGLPAYNPQPAMEMYQDIFKRATEGSINSFDTAANRLRERLDSAAQGQRIQAQSQDLGRGGSGFFGGIAQRNMNEINRNYLGEYAQGLSSLANQFETQRLTGLGLGNQAAAGVAGEQQFGFKGLLEQALANAQNQTSASIANANNSTSLAQTQIGQGNSILEMLIRALSQYGG